MDGVAGFEPANDRTKICWLTACLHPIEKKSILVLKKNQVFLGIYVPFSFWLKVLFVDKAGATSYSLDKKQALFSRKQMGFIFTRQIICSFIDCFRLVLADNFKIFQCF